MSAWTFELDNPTLQLWSASFPDVNIIQELAFMDEWLSRHPRRKGTKRFVSNWLKAEQRKIGERRKELHVGRAPRGTVRPEVMKRIREREKTLDTK